MPADDGWGYTVIEYRGGGVSVGHSLCGQRGTRKLEASLILRTYDVEIPSV